MRALLKSALAALVAIVATVAAPDASFARGGGGGGRGGGGRGGGGAPRGGGRGASPKGVGTKGGKNSKSNQGGLRGKTPGDYLDQDQRDNAEAALPEFLANARYGSLQNSADADRDAALRAAREKASSDRRGASEDSSHPL